MDVEMVCACAYCLGVHGEEETPVPIPNTEVKLLSGDYTALRETSTMPNYMKSLLNGRLFILLMKISFIIAT